MPESQSTKNHFQLNGGLNTEANEISFPDGFTTNEANYELLLDGSRRRRKGLAQESGGSVKGGVSIAGDEYVTQAYLWKNVGGDPTKKFWVHRMGNNIFFTDDAVIISTTYHTQTLDLDDYRLGGIFTAATPCDFTSGKGELFVSNENTKPLRVSYNATTDVFNVDTVDIQIRDFSGIDDGVPIDFQPADDGTPALDEIAADHYYNIMNRGWQTDDILTYATGRSKYPGKNMAPHRGYIRALTASTSYDFDGAMSFDATKMGQEALHAHSSAPQGSLFLNVFDDTEGIVESSRSSTTLSDLSVAITDDSVDPWELTIDETGHSHIATDVVAFTLILDTYNNNVGGTTQRRLSGGYTVTGVNANDFTIEVPKPSDFLSQDANPPTAYWVNNIAVPRSSGTGPLTVGPKAIEFHESRLWYAGIPDSAWADYVFFSQIAVTEKEYNRCHMEADPTDRDVNALQDSDGGYIVIPDIGNVIKMVSLQSSLLIFSDEGVWEVTGTRNGVFTADNYSVRKITDAECTSPYSPIKITGQLIYTGPKGIYLVAPNQFTSKLEATNISQDRIQTAWNSIGATHQPRVRTVYDDAKKKVYFMHGGDGNQRTTGAPSVSTIARFVNTMFVLDLRTGSWAKYEFRSAADEGILTAFAISGADDSDSNSKLKFICQVSTGGSLRICDFNQTDYLDFDGSEAPLPYMLSGWDNIGNFQSRRQAPIITVFAKRTETGYTQAGSGWDADNESSNLLTAYWDWSDDSVSGKIGSQNETYRHPRGFVPSGATDVNGYPVVTTRNKVRGRGRVLQLRFDGAATKDSHILGFTTNYKITRNK